MLFDQANLLQSLGWAVLNSFWQMALLWLVYQLITGTVKSARPSSRSALASLLLITGFAWFMYTFITFNNGRAYGSAIPTFSVFQNEGIQQTGTGLQNILFIVSVLYMALLLFPIARFMKNIRYVRVIRQYGLSKADVQWRIFVEKVAARMGLKKPVRIWVSEFVSSPVTIGFLKPVILIPLAAINHLSTAQMEAVLLHELAHIRRNDYLVNLVINIIQTILYFNPFARAFVKIVEKEREKSCDEMVLQFEYDSYEYATALLTLEKSNLEYKLLAVGAAGNKNDLLERVKLIMGAKTNRGLSFNKLTGFLAGLICILSLQAFLFSGKPGTGKIAVSPSLAGSPFRVFTEGSLVTPVKPVTEKQKINAGISPVQPASVQGKELIPVVPTSTPAAGIMNAAFNKLAEYSLKLNEEAQVKAALDASKKVLENAEWKALEKNIADVFTQKEKEELKATYRSQLNKFDWNTWENKLRLAYDQVDWNQVNEKLNYALNSIRMDSLQKVYTETICKLDETQLELSRNKLNGIPDTDITVQTIEERKRQVQKTLNILKAIRNKKTVHL